MAHSAHGPAESASQSGFNQQAGLLVTNQRGAADTGAWRCSLVRTDKERRKHTQRKGQQAGNVAKQVASQCGASKQGCMGCSLKQRAGRERCKMELSEL